MSDEGGRFVPLGEIAAKSARDYDLSRAKLLPRAAAVSHTNTTLRCHGPWCCLDVAISRQGTGACA